MSCGSSTPSAPPNTHASCSTVSERPNAEARDAFGQVALDHRVQGDLRQRAARRAEQRRPRAAVPIPGRNAAATGGGRRDADGGQDQGVGVVEALPRAEGVAGERPDPRGRADQADERELPGRARSRSAP